MAVYDMITIGHVTNNIVINDKLCPRFIGGAAYFASFAAQKSGARVHLVTKLADKDFHLLDAIWREGISINVIPCPETTTVEKDIKIDSEGHPSIRVLSQADPFRVDDIPSGRARIYHLAGLLTGEIPERLIAALSLRGKVGLDLQAMLRCGQCKSGKFTLKDWPGRTEYLPLVTFLKADVQEAEVITGTSNPEVAAKILLDYGANEVMITCPWEVIVYNGKEFSRASFDSKNDSGRIGRGDTCFGSYMAWRIHHGIEESVAYAAALTSIKLENPGPFLGNTDDVLTRMDTLRRKCG